ncbi:MAG: gamma-glutamyl-gamma-aminobutyrate hydrolase family protein [Planctomycetota bacterium]|nr:gamma-glutamyl-gamma-aminobutyrate hydrolase family protein [Planctomycetota bacterium]
MPAKTKKPVIAINGEYRAEKGDAHALTWVNTGYYDSVSAAGGLPVLVPPVSDDADLSQFLSLVDGVVLTGSNLDLDPVRLGFDKNPSTRPMANRREDFDRRLCKLAVEKRLPILAIGSGMQLLNVMCGGSLFQHIPEDVPKALHHRDKVEISLRHVLEIVPGTRTDAIYGPGEIRVNSQHHMALNQVASPFKVAATCPDGVVEAIESVDEDWFCMGVQWHPENATASALDLQIFQTFLAACDESEPSILPMPKRRSASRAAA